MSAMREQYRVIVTREITGDDGETEYVTEFEAAARTAAQLARFAPGEVLAALGGKAGGTVASDAVDTSYMTPDGPVTATDGTPQTETGAARRKRRTKAEIAADEAAAARIHAVAQLPASASPEAQQAPTSPLPAGVESPLAEPLPAAPAPAAPYNPFAVAQ